MKQSRDLEIGIIHLAAEFDATSGKWVFNKGGRWYELTTADVRDVGKALQHDTALEQVQALCTPQRPLEEALQLAETALGIHSRVEGGALVLEKALGPFSYIFFTRQGEKITEGTAQDFFAAARRVLETYRADEVYANIWDGPQSGGAVR